MSDRNQSSPRTLHEAAMIADDSAPGPIEAQLAELRRRIDAESALPVDAPDDVHDCMMEWCEAPLRAWADRTGEFILPRARFLDALETRGFVPQRRNTGWGFYGLRLIQHDYTAAHWNR